VNTEHPITPHEELVEEWGKTVLIDYSDTHWGYEQILCAMAARWGADQELEACCDTLQRHAHWDLAVYELMADRRPKPPSLKEQAIAALNEIEDHMLEPTNQEKLIRRALEQL